MFTDGAAACPVPDSGIDCGLPGALSATEILAVLLPVAAGVNFAVIVQVEPAFTDVQLLVWENSLAFVPVIVMPVTTRVTLPVLVSTMACPALCVPTI